jgi:Protein of unknown function (DUF3027)
MNDTKSVRARWSTRLSRDQSAPEYLDEWRTQQCLHCIFYIRLSNSLGEDFGACANEQSKFDMQVRFEHDGCNEQVHEGDA